MHGRMYSDGLGAAVLISGIKKKNQNMIHTVLILISEIKKKSVTTTPAPLFEYLTPRGKAL